MIGLSAERSQSCSESWYRGRPSACISLPRRYPILVSLIASPQMRRPRPSFSGTTFLNRIAGRARATRRELAFGAPHEIQEIRDALEAFKPAVEAGEMAGFKGG